VRGSLARVACGWVSEGVTPFLPDHRPTGHYLSVNAGWPATLPRSGTILDFWCGDPDSDPLDPWKSGLSRICLKDFQNAPNERV
jgi:hypothetical protein